MRKSRYVRKTAAAVTSLAMLAAMCVPASADTIKENGGTATHEVTATYKSSDTVYSVDIEWGSMEFTYETGDTWNPTNLEYTESGSGTWTCENDGTDNKVTVTNSSNAAIKATLAFEGKTTSDDTNITTNITGEFDSTTLSLASAADSNEATTASALLSISGGAISETSDSVTIGTITVTINASGSDEEQDLED